MANDSLVQEEDIQQAPVQDTMHMGHPQEQLEVEDGGSSIREDVVVYPTGGKLWLTMISVCIFYFLAGLDLTIVAVAVPSLTDQFKTTADIGWYNAAYGLSLSAFVFFFGKAYTIFPMKSVFMLGVFIFELGSLLCTVATSSNMFIFGRSLAGLGASAFVGGLFKLLNHLVPLPKQALMIGIVGACQSVGLVTAPMLGGLLIDAFSWRACFGINLPLGVVCMTIIWFAFKNPVANPDTMLPVREKLKRLDIFGTLLVVPCIACLLLGLQWGGIKYSWSDWRIILLMCVFAVLFFGFGYLQHCRGENATIPLRILKNRSIIAGMWFSACCNGILAMTEYYIAIYFQGVQGYSPTKSGLLGLPMIVGLAVASMLGAVGVTMLGYYYPFMLATSVLAPIASGLLTTIDLEASVVKPAALLGFLGFAIGIGIQSPQTAVQTVMSPKDVSLGGAVVTFGAGLGSAIWICIASTMFNNRLFEEIVVHAPSTNVTALEAAGLSGIRDYIGQEKLRDVLTGYNVAVVQTLYLPLALGILTLAGSIAMERRSIKEKRS